MSDIEDPKASTDENHPFVSENNTNTVNDNARNNQTNDKHTELDDDTIYENMIFPS